MECVDDCYSDYSLTELIKLDQSSQNVRLVNGSSSYEGVVEAYHGEQWAGFCSLTYFQANLVCQELGYEGVTKILFKAVESSVASGNVDDNFYREDKLTVYTPRSLEEAAI